MTNLGKRFIGLFAAAYGIVALFSCGSPGTVGDPPSSSAAGGSAGVNIDINAGTIGSQGGTAGGSSGSNTDPGSTAGTCGTTTADTTRALADVLIVLDRTESMNQSMSANSSCDPTDPNCTSRLTAVVPAVGDVVSKNTDIHWGLELYTTPGGGSCVVAKAPQVPVAADSGPAIKAVLDAITTESSTPTALALTVATDYLKTVNDGNSKAILLATDGEPNCANGRSGSSDLPGATNAAAAALAAGFPVYVIGIGPSVSNLDALAKAGGTTNYYPATSTAELGAALSAIAKTVSNTCTFKAATRPPDKNLVYVYVDKGFVAKNDANGWVFDPADPTFSTITLTGSYCTDLLAGKTTQVQIVFGCPNVTPPLVIP
jgi:hypothetical protein